MNERTIEVLADSFFKILIPGLTMTIPLTLISFVLGLVLALLTALVQIGRVPVLRQLARVYIWIIRGTPLLVQLFVMFYGLPVVGIQTNAFTAAVIMFSINTGAYASETIRAAIESVPVGQLEAGYCAGMTWDQTMQRIILPQAMRTAFPPLSNTLIGLVKDTSLASSITVIEMMQKTKQIAARTYEHFALYCEVALIYLIFCTVITFFQHTCEKYLNRNGGL